MQVDVGRFVPIERMGGKCERWFGRKFQTCLKLEIKDEFTHVYLINGHYYQRGKDAHHLLELQQLCMFSHEHCADTSLTKNVWAISINPKFSTSLYCICKCYFRRPGINPRAAVKNLDTVRGSSAEKFYTNIIRLQAQL